MTDLTMDVGKMLFSVLEGRINTHSFATVNNNRFAGSRVTVNERVAFFIPNKVRKLEYYPKIHIN